MNIHIFILFNSQTIIQKVKIFFLIQKKNDQFHHRNIKKKVLKKL